jgi:hypothetical protein
MFVGWQRRKPEISCFLSDIIWLLFPPPPHMPCAWKKKKNSYLSKVTVSQIFFSSQLNKMPTYKQYVRNTACHSREIKVYSIRKKEAESTLHRN